MKKDITGKKTRTILTHAGSKPDEYHGAVNVPVHRMSTIVMRDYAQFEKVPNVPYSYGRAGTPTSAAFEEGIAAAEGAYRSVATCSGLSAILTSLLAFAHAGDHILMPDNCYGPSRKSCEEVLRRFGVDVEYYPPMIGADIKKLFRPNTKLVFMEAPGSLTFEVQDIGAMPALMMAMGAWAQSTVSRETQDEVEKVYKKDGVAFKEEYRKDGSSAEMSMMLANGVLIEVSGDNVNIDGVRAAMNALDVKGLSGLQRQK